MTNDNKINYSGKIMEVEGLRGIAILLVTVHHFWPEANGFFNDYSKVAHLGWVGVDLFFVISGFLIGGILLDTKNDPRYFYNFYNRRILRIFPLYYAFVLLAFIAIPSLQSYIHNTSYWQTEFIQQSGSPLWYLLFAGNIREAITGVEPAYILAPLWSLSIEEQFYLLSPLLIFKLNKQNLSRLLLFFLILSPAFRAVMYEVYPDNERIQYLATISRFDNLSVGLLLALLVRSGVAISRQFINASLLILSILFAITFLYGGFDRYTYFCRIFGYSFLALYFMVAVMWTIQQRDSALTSFLRSRILVYLGGMCFGLYLLQRPVEIILLKGLLVFDFDLESSPILSLSLKTLFSVIVSHFVWHFFEKPINNLKRKFSSHEHPLYSK
jgi:peptidoglycan/LPS O-acetylase OafA/YrhL